MISHKFVSAAALSASVSALYWGDEAGRRERSVYHWQIATDNILAPEVLITRENDPPYLVDGLIRANGYAFMFKEHWEGFKSADLSDEWKNSLQEMIGKAQTFNWDKDWDREMHPNGKVVNSCLFRGNEVVVPLEMLFDE